MATKWNRPLTQHLLPRPARARDTSRRRLTILPRPRRLQVLLTALQMFWGSKVIAGILRKIQGVHSDKDD